MADQSAPRLLILAGMLAGLCAGPATPEPMAPTVPAYSAQRAYEYLEVLAGQIGERAAGTPAESARSTTLPHSSNLGART